MKKKFIKALTLFLATMLTTGPILSCGSSTGNSGGNENKPQGDDKVEVTQTDKNIVYRAKTDYKLLIDDNASNDVMVASAEFNLFFKEATGLELDVVTDENVTYSETAKYISLGRNDFQEAAGVDTSVEAVKSDGYVIKTVGESIFVVGGADKGVLYGVYGLLNYLVDYECFGIDNYSIRKNVGTVELYNFDVTEIPDFIIRTAGYGSLDGSPDTKNRLRLQISGKKMSINGAIGHTSLYFVPTERYLNQVENPNEYHPKWYMDGSTPAQLCYSAHGDAEEYDAMVRACFETLKEEAIAQPEATEINFSMADNTEWCGCTACKTELEATGSMAAGTIRLLNDLDDMIYEWFETPEGAPYKRDLYFVFYAYMQLEAPPTYYDETNKKWTLIDEKYRLNDHVVVQICITNGNYTQNLSDGERNKQAKNAVDAWQACANRLQAYMYSANYREYLVPLDTFNAMQDWYTYYYEAGAEKMYDLGQSNEFGTHTGWSNLKIYLNAKLAWNVYADYNQLIDDYFQTSFHDAAPIMRGIFDEWRALSRYNSNYVGGYLSSVISAGPYLLYSKFWPQNMLNSWRADIDTALAAIESLKDTDARSYATAKRLILAERVWIDYVLYKVYADKFTGEDLRILKTELREAIVACNIGLNTENGSIDALLEELK